MKPTLHEEYIRGVRSPLVPKFGGGTVAQKELSLLQNTGAVVENLNEIHSQLFDGLQEYPFYAKDVILSLYNAHTCYL